MGADFARLWAMKSVGTSRPASATRPSERGAADRGGERPESERSLPRIVTLVGAGRITLDLDGRVDARIAAITGAQRGRVSREQLLAAGVGNGAIWRRLRNGDLERVHDGVYAAPHTSELPLAPETAALLACGEGALLSHHSAVTLWGLRPGTARPIHVTIPGERGFCAPAGVKLHRSRILTPRDVRLHQDLPITSPARSLLDVAAALPDRDVEQILSEGLFALRLLTRAEIVELLARAGNHPGRARLTRVANAHVRDTRTDSPPEERLLLDDPRDRPARAAAAGPDARLPARLLLARPRTRGRGRCVRHARQPRAIRGRPRGGTRGC